MKDGDFVSENNWNIGIRLKFFFITFSMGLILYVILGGMFLGFDGLSELNIDWKFIVIISLLNSVFSVSKYKKIKIEIPIEDKVSFTILFRDCLEYTRLKIINENNDVFIVKPKLSWADIWLWKEKVSVTVDENQAILTGPSVYVEKIKIMLNTFS
ncbi:hypothetical protein [Alkaliphilus sp. B6464]|uniref:hypothetical protein n=1 Tax=Alkaliphilus sp. B6464 TaxID=2731219 RepID=UPI001BADBCC1|nr:hypothetical protein [Alkaliphilus sp. B6464]QUH20524.1 hypothetical protein HYG84_11990 [Alkaliphilus sp. B6464]